MLSVVNPTPAGHPLDTEVPVASYTRSISHTTQPATANTHRHSRTISSSTLPANPFAASQPQRRSQYPSSSRTMDRHSTTSTPSIPRRSISGRSVITNSPSSYVTLMRKQKATVWCDRSQSIDARVAAEQKRAKQRALNEVSGNNARTSTLSSGVVGKIRHGGVPKAQQYTSPNLSGVNVPTRLLAYDMQGEDEPEGRVLGDNSMVHARTGSGKSSINSGKYRSGYPRTHTSPPETGSPRNEGIPEAGETPSASTQQDYFEKKAATSTASSMNAGNTVKPATRPDFIEKKSSDSEESFGELKDMTGPSSKLHAMDLKAKEEDLRRRGSVDERTTTMRSTQRLFIANPDIED